MNAHQIPPHLISKFKSMATWRLLSHHHHHPASLPFKSLATSTIIPTTTTANSKKKKITAGKPKLPAATSASSPEHLKKRTRSAAVFDKELYRRYAPGGSLGLDHVPVLLREVLDAFAPLHLRSFVDCTLGAAGHSSAIIDAHRELELYVGLDIDCDVHAKAKARIEKLLSKDCREGLRAYTHVRNFKYIKSVLGGVDEELLNVGVDGILMDLGMSSMQVNRSERGFSVLSDGPLDMRMNPQAALTAEEILNSWPEAEIGKILRDYGEETNWNFIQKQIVKARATGGLHSTSDLVELVKRSSPKSGGRQGWMKTATRVFQALRIAVNDELQTLEDAIYACFDCLSPGGRLAIISFHSLEDRIVKKTFLDIIGNVEGGDISKISASTTKEDNEDEEASSKRRVQGQYGTVLTKRPITPSKEEENMNGRCRSAKLRVVQKG